METWQTGKFTEALDRRPEEQPFFAVCSFNAPHFPMIVPAPYDTLVKPEDVKLPENFLKGTVGKPAEVLNSPYFKEMQGYNELEWRTFIAHYLGLCALIDKQVGDIVGYLKRNGLYEDTIIVFLSDHGDMMGAHGTIKKGYPLHYKEALRVPLIIAGAGELAPAESKALISLIDVVPTLADLTGVTVKQTIEGRSFAPLMLGERSIHRDYVLAETFKMGGEENAMEGGERSAPEQFKIGKDGVNISVRTDNLKYIFRYKDIEELYDLETDPYENVNAAADPSKANALFHMRGLMLEELRGANPFLEQLVSAKLKQR